VVNLQITAVRFPNNFRNFSCILARLILIFISFNLFYYVSISANILQRDDHLLLIITNVIIIQYQYHTGAVIFILFQITKF